jgi:predicted ATPase
MNATTVMSDERSELLERSRELATLRESLAAVAAGSRGKLALVAGEAGVGKTALLRRLSEEPHGARLLWGSCAALFTPRPLGPLLEIAELTGGAFAVAMAADSRPHDVVGALLRELGTRAPTVLVLEDLHWADEATLDVLRLLPGRIATVPALVIATYRDDELERDHPLRIVLGELGAGEGIERLALQLLSREAVATLAEPYGLDADDLYRTTTGNPFFVTEVLAAEKAEIPPTVRDAVLARMARVSPAARTLLEAVSLVPPQAELSLLEASRAIRPRPSR